VTDTMQTHDLMDELAVLDPETARLHLNDFEELCLRVGDGEPVGPLRLHRAFPVTAAGDFVCLKNMDGKEVGIIRRVADLDRASRAVVEAELARGYFTAAITRVEAIDVEYHVPAWTVATDRGPRRFELRSSHRDLRVLGWRVLIRDADGNRYEIPDLRRLDPASRSLVEEHI
jgi:hypothetical protein